MPRLQIRRVVSLSMLLVGLVLALTGLVLYIAPAGKIAYWSDWHLLGLDKEQLGAIHTITSFTFVILGVLHTWYNWKAIVSYLKDKARRLRVFTPEMVVAVVLTLLLTVGSALSWPPFAQVMDLGAAVKDWWEEHEGSPPYGHAELASLSSTARKLDVPVAQASAALSAAGFSVADPSQTLQEIARAHHTSPAAVYAVIQAARPVDAEGAPAAPDPQPSGLGKRTIAEHCAAEGLELVSVQAMLAEKGVEAAPESTLKELAGQLGTTPMELVGELGGQ
ncbi:MAG: DUF4405 domain-containing protein [Pseudomonadota bacterium]